MKEQKPTIAIFKNDNAGKPILKDGRQIEFNGKPLTISDLNGKITLPDPLDAGEYEVAIYKKESKNGLIYYSGTIKPAFKKNKNIQSDNTLQDDFPNDEIHF